MFINANEHFVFKNIKCNRNLLFKVSNNKGEKFMSQTISNQAHVTFSYSGAREARTNDSNVVNHTMNDRYCFEVEKTANVDCFRAGVNITYFIHVTNCGCGCLSDFRICDNLGGEDYLTYVEDSARIFINGSMESITPSSTDPLEFYVDYDLVRDEEFILEYTAIVNEDISSEVEEITNTVTVYACPCSSCNSNSATPTGTGSNCICESDSTTITKCGYAEVLITKTVSNDTICCDSELDYFITLTNTGNIDAENVVITDYLPDNFNTTEIHMENNGNHYQFASSEYTIDASNLLTLPNETGTAILVPALGPGTDNTTRIRIHGHM